MNVELIRPREEHIPELARICYEAFGALQDRHAVPRDFPHMDMAHACIAGFVSRPDFYAVAAAVGGKLVGSNFLMTTDPVAGVGPITVDPACQSRGVGRRLMQAVMDEADRRGIAQVRLQQEAVNTTSLSLYTALGFTWRDSCALMSTPPATAPAAPPAAPSSTPDPTVRPATAADLPDIERLAQRTYHNSRRGEVASALEHGMPVFVRDGAGGQDGGVGDGGLAGYLIPGFIGHGFARTDSDMLALIREAGRLVPEPLAQFICPLSQAGLFRSALAAGCRTKKVLSYMTRGPFDPPRGAWVPSILC